ncbi:branched-chain amino acid ABC transporter permease [Bacillus sp. Marseille-P3661]|uniref:branched-chain amino acid ABC transporter permease n=1 Tax=Bacillus sp. Marseille-P3661 TaxID=1936234 RepID=UPI000C82EDEA|nr:branched-chain amino acid ABC transporter permease [Bacillus sp. Marseille-P3661]
MVTATIVGLDVISSIAILFLVAIGLAIIFGLMGVVNLAHGELLMLGAYSAYLTTSLGLSPWLALLIAPIVVALFGLVLERLLIRRLYGKIMESILATWGVGIVIRQCIEMIFGKNYKPVPMPIDQSVSMFDVSYPLYRILIVFIAIAVVIMLVLIERKTNVGVTVRAVIKDPVLSSSLGINVNRAYTTTFVVGSALAGFAGALLAPFVSVYPGMGVCYVMNAFFLVLVGGMGSILGVAGSATILGGSQTLISFWYDSIWGSISIVVLAMVIMRFRKTNLS